MTKESQKKLIESYLLSGNKITPIDALTKFSCFRLAAVVHVLRKEGMNILSNMHTHSGKKYAVYQYIPDGNVKKTSSSDKNNWIPDFQF